MEQWKPYKYLWKNERSMRELLAVSLPDFENTLRKHSELEDKLSTELDLSYLGTSIALCTEKLKFGLTTEIKSKQINLLLLMRQYNVTCHYNCS